MRIRLYTPEQLLFGKTDIRLNKHTLTTDSKNEYVV